MKWSTLSETVLNLIPENRANATSAVINVSQSRTGDVSDFVTMEFLAKFFKHGERTSVGGEEAGHVQNVSRSLSDEIMQKTLTDLLNVQ